MTDSLSRQVLLPLVSACLIVAIVLAWLSFWWAGRQAAAESQARLTTVADTLADTSFPITPAVLDILRNLSNLEFVVGDGQGRLRTFSEGLDQAAALSIIESLEPGKRARSASSGLSPSRMLTLGQQQFRATTLFRPVGPDNLLILLEPQTQRRAQLWSLALLPLLTGMATLILVGAVALLVTQHLVRRIGSVEHQVQRIAQGDLQQMSIVGPDDQLASLARSVNCMASELRSTWRTIRDTERSRLLSQVASGLAHQLRNAITGIHLAVQLHRRDCPLANQESLAVAEAELARTSAYIQQLLHSAVGHTQPIQAGSLTDVLDQAQSLLETIAQHRRVELAWQRSPEAEQKMIDDTQLLRSAVMNLVLNALDAAGPGGHVTVRSEPIAGHRSTVRIAVSDSGPGPTPDLSDHIFEPFVSTKPEGLGVGLSVVRSAAEALGGLVRWRREHDQTIFELDL